MELLQINSSLRLPFKFFFKLTRNDLGFKYSEEAYKKKDAWLRYVNLPPWIDPVRSDPGFKNLLKKIGLD